MRFKNEIFKLEGVLVYSRGGIDLILRNMILIAAFTFVCGLRDSDQIS